MKLILVTLSVSGEGLVSGRGGMVLERGWVCLCSPWLILSHLGLQLREVYMSALVSMFTALVACLVGSLIVQYHKMG